MINESGGVQCFLVSKERRAWGKTYLSSSMIKAAAKCYTAKLHVQSQLLISPLCD